MMCESRSTIQEEMNIVVKEILLKVRILKKRTVVMISTAVVNTAIANLSCVSRLRLKFEER